MKSVFQLSLIFIAACNLLPPALGGDLTSLTFAPGVFERAEKNFGVTGSFVQIWMDHLKFSKQDWAREMRVLHSLGTKTIIIQYVSGEDHRGAGFEYSLVTPKVGETDPVAAILDYADKNGMEVYLGGHFDNRWLISNTDVQVLKHIVAKHEVLLPALWHRYSRHRSLAGWFIPYETQDLDFKDASPFAADIHNLNLFLKRMASIGRKAADRRIKILLSAFFVGQKPANYVEYTYQVLLKGTGIDVLLVQDGMGVRHWRSPETQVIPYLKAFKSACDANKMQMWSIVESFDMDTKLEDWTVEGIESKVLAEFRPATIDSLREHIELVRPYSQRIIQFDGFHYMSPFRGPDREKLYQDVRALIDAVK